MSGGIDLGQFTHPNQRAHDTDGIGAERWEDMVIGACENSLQIASIY